MIRKKQYLFTIVVLLLVCSFSAVQAGSLVGWGEGYLPDDVVAISAGHNHSVVIKSDGSLFAWSDDSSQVSDVPAGTDFVSVSASFRNHRVAIRSDGSLVAWGGDYSDSYGQVSNTPTGTGFIAVSAGESHNLAVKSDGSLVAWGRDNYGQVSDTPTGTGFIAVAAGRQHSVAIESDGSLVAWGADWNGKVSNIPTGTDFVAVSVGRDTCLALRSDGSLVAWGDDYYDQVRNTPTGTDFVAISAGYGHSVALKSDGSIVAWGFNHWDQVSTTPAGTGFVAIAAGGYHSIAIRADGKLIAWGRGRGYNGKQTPKYFKILPSGMDFISIAVSQVGSHSVALKSDGSLIAWGSNSRGQVSNTPTGTDFLAVSAGTRHNVALKSDGSLVAWGDDYAWEGGSYGGQVSNTPTGTGFIAVAAGGTHNVALKSDGSLVAWGDDYFGNVSSTPTGTGFIAISAGYRHSVAVKSDGSLVAWGYDSFEWINNAMRPAGAVNNTPTGTGFIAVAAGGGHSVALRSDGSLVSWGSDYYYGQVSDTPVDTGFIAVAAGRSYSVALKSDGSLVAWGDNGKGQASDIPTDTGFVAIAAGRNYGIAIRDSVVATISHVPNGYVSGPVHTAKVTFLNDMDTSSFSLTDDVVNFTGPTGSLAVAGHRWIDSRTLAISFDPQSSIGGYELVVGPDILTSDEIAMDTNGNGIAGEPEDVYAAKWTIDPSQSQEPDLIVSNISFPTNAVVGQEVTISYSIENTGTDVATGYWLDAIFISSDDAWDINDTLHTLIVNTNELTDGDTMDKSVTLPLLGLLPGDYYIIIRTDSRGEISEWDETNNVTTSVATFSVDIPELVTDSTVINGSLTPEDRYDYYKINVTDNENDLQVTLDAIGDSGSNELYIKYGSQPTRSEFDYRSSTALMTDQYISVPYTRIGTYYVMIYGSSIPDSSSEYAIFASHEADPYLFDLAPNTGGNAGNVTIQLRGVNLAEESIYELIASDGTSIQTIKSTSILNSTYNLSITFDLTGVALGIYDIRVTRPDASYTTFEDVFTIADGYSPEFFADLSVPGWMRFPRPFHIYISYGNKGTNDMFSPLLTLSVPNGIEMQLPNSAEWVSGPAISLLALNQEGLANVLPPGYSDVISIKTRALVQGTYTIGLSSTDTLPGGASDGVIDWSNLFIPLEPGVEDPVRDALIPEIQATFGDTWGEYVANLGEVAAEMALHGEWVYDADRLQKILVRRIGAGSQEAQVNALAQLDSSPLAVPATASLDSYGEPGAVYYYDYVSDKLLPAVKPFVDPAKETVVIIHGNANNIYTGWIKDMSQALYQRHQGQKNILAIGWGEWAKGTINVRKSAKYIPEVAEIASRYLFGQSSTDYKELALSPAKTHLIGHSLGAHVAGCIGKNVNPNKIKRITALDAADEVATSDVANSWGVYSADFVDFYKSSVYYGGETPWGLDNFLLVRSGETWDDHVRANLSEESRDHSYAYEWFTRTINGWPGGLGYDWMVGREDDKWSDIVDATTLQWKGLIRGDDGGGGNVVELFEPYWIYPGPWRGTYGGTSYVEKMVSDITAAVDFVIYYNTYIPTQWKPSEPETIGFTIKNEANNKSINQTSRLLAQSGRPNYTIWLSEDSDFNPAVDFRLPGITYTSNTPFIDTQSEKVFTKSITLPSEQVILQAMSQTSLQSDYYLIVVSGYNPLWGLWYDGELYPEDNWESHLIHIIGSLVPDAGPDQNPELLPGNTNIAVTLSGSGSSPASEIHKYEWSGLPGNSGVATGEEIAHNFEEGVWQITLTVYDKGADGQANTDDDRSASDYVIIMVSDPGVDAKAGDDQYHDLAIGNTTHQVTLNGSGSTSETGINKYEWECKTHSRWLGLGAIIARDFEEGTHDVALTVTGNGEDGIGGNDDDPTGANTVEITINPAPQLSAYAGNYQELTLASGQSTVDVYLNGSLSTPANQIDHYEWSEGARHLGTGVNCTVNLSRGTHHITLKVVNNSGPASHSHVVTIEVLPHPDDEKDVWTASSMDPNKKVGPKGVDLGNFLKDGSLMPYTIYFENDPDKATAAAQEIRVVDVLDDDLDLSTFELTEIAFANHVISVPAGMSYYETSVDLRPDGIDAIAQIQAGLDIDTRTITLNMKAVDPETGDWPEHPLVGLLYPNDETHRGEGHIGYLIHAKKGLPTGTVIENEAKIYFDYNDPIDTPMVFNTIDAAGPSSQVDALPAVIEEAQFLVSWYGEDDENGSGIASYDIYVSKDGGDYSLWLGDTTETSAIYTAEDGHYAFYSVARDLVGHKEQAPDEPDAVIEVDLNSPPVADAGADQTVPVGSDCSVIVALDGSSSFDEDGDAITHLWSLDDEEIASGVNLTVQLSLGVHTISLIVNDGQEDSLPDYVTITVEDVTPPELSVTVDQNMLWPPNHKMVKIGSVISASDNCGGSVDVVLISITMNEGEETNTYEPDYDNTLGDGHTLDDIQVDADANIYLRAERSGKGNGRVYTITYQATDASGNSTKATATVTVPHSQP